LSANQSLLFLRYPLSFFKKILKKAIAANVKPNFKGFFLRLATISFKKSSL
jgi:hypothetical protein